uniref:Uncharacterized protein n=1 Tax=Arundo donax TaxID=35708 RepID=A0A0A9AG06_ARUDO
MTSSIARYSYPTSTIS